MLRSRLLDRGREVMYVYPVTTVTNDRGTQLQVIADTPIKIYVTTKEDRSSDAELPGQVSAKVLRVHTRYVPVSSWGRIIFNGEEWDIALPPRFAPGMSRSTQHVEFTIRSRNGIGVTA